MVERPSRQDSSDDKDQWTILPGFLFDFREDSLYTLIEVHFNMV